LSPLALLHPSSRRSRPDAGTALRDALQDAGGIFVKFGQVLSTRTELVSPTVAQALSSLQDQVRAVPVADVHRVIEDELGRSVDDLFASVIDLEASDRHLARFLSERFDHGVKIGAGALVDLLELILRFGLAVDPELAGMFRALATLDGTIQAMSPGFDLVVEAQHIARQRA
jgi:predicted unusual protein kinase regulating ubiquinone biosynthesis (AarF/ABC1/UbiB family)